MTNAGEGGSRRDSRIALVGPPGVDAARIRCLAAFLAKKVEFDALLLTGAGRHIAGEITVPANGSLVFLPPYSPKLNPTERL